MHLLRSNQRRCHCFGFFPFFPALLFIVLTSEIAQSQAPSSPITPSGLNTVVTTTESSHTISGGTRAGANLFHSFGEFNVPTGHIANFFNDSGITTSNILGRVTGNNPSSIFGTIQTTGFRDANLFLMNPNGMVFGPNASLNVVGSVTFTTANYLRLAEINGATGIFHADTALSSVLSSAPITSFGFLGSPAAIAVQGSRLSVSNGETLSLVGGNQGFNYINPDTGITAAALNGVMITDGRLSAISGQIALTSVASRGEVSAANFMPISPMTMGDITLAQGTLLDVSANRAGTVRIRGGQLTIDNASISADTVNADGSPIAIDIHVTGEMSLANDLSPTLTARTTGTGHAGTINIESGTLEAVTSSLEDGLVALIDTHTSGTGTAGNVTISTRDLHATDQAFFIDTGTAGTGHGGDVSIQSDYITIEGPNIATGNFRFGQLLGQDVSGSAGNLAMKSTQRLQIGPAATISTEAWFSQGGNMTLEGHNVRIIGNSFVSVDGDFGGATITVNADQLRLDFSSVLNSNTVVDPGGKIIINAKNVQLTEGSRIQTSTLGDGTAGDINITASERLILDGRDNETSLPSAIVSNFYALGLSPNGIGGSGAITVQTPHLQIFGGALINTSTNNSGNAGNISIVSHSVTISGQSQFEVPNTSLEIGSTRGSGIYTRTVGSDLCLEPCGDAGTITVISDSLKLDRGATINSGTTNEGFGGNISLTARQGVTISDGAAISASSTGPGNAGNISINAGRQLDARNSPSAITTEAKHASGGNIDIQAIDRIRLANSSITTSVPNGTGNGGNITIDPNVVILQHSNILAQAAQGQGGNITITTPVFLQDQASLVDASSQFGVSGTVTIQSPTSNLSETVTQLTSKPSDTQALLQNRCAALAGGEQSTFIVAARDALPSQPGGWLSSPVSMDHFSGEGLEHATNPSAIARVTEAEIVSLRRLTPPGFLVRAFASGSTGCHS